MSTVITTEQAAFDLFSNLSHISQYWIYSCTYLDFIKINNMMNYIFRYCSTTAELFKIINYFRQDIILLNNISFVGNKEELYISNDEPLYVRLFLERQNTKIKKHNDIMNKYAFVCSNMHIQISDLLYYFDYSYINDYSYITDYVSVEDILSYDYENNLDYKSKIRNLLFIYYNNYSVISNL